MFSPLKPEKGERESRTGGGRVVRDTTFKFGGGGREINFFPAVKVT
jgi:hypothetical protein